MESDCCAIILAGGKSRRMGFPKPYLDFGGRTFVEKIIETYKLAGVERIVVVLNRNYILPARKNLLNLIKQDAEIVVNENNLEGRLHSIKLGLNSFRNLNYCFIQNIDNPLTPVELLKELYSNKNSEGYVLPISEGKGGHPILTSKPVIDAILKNDKTEIPLREILLKFPRTEIIVNDPSVLLNINTPDEYLKYLEIIGQVRH